MTLNYHIIGKRIRLTRRQQGLSQMELAEMVDKSPTYLSLVESGKKKLSLEMLVDTANALNVTVDMLLGECVTHNGTAISAEFESLFAECSEYERRLIIDNARELKRLLRENRHLMQSPK